MSSPKVLRSAHVAAKSATGNDALYTQTRNQEKKGGRSASSGFVIWCKCLYPGFHFPFFQRIFRNTAILTSIRFFSSHTVDLQTGPSATTTTPGPLCLPVVSDYATDMDSGLLMPMGGTDVMDFLYVITLFQACVLFSNREGYKGCHLAT
jgi:hypothetical protein